MRGKPGRPRFRDVLVHVREVRPDIDDPEAMLTAGRLVVGGAVVGNTSARVRADAPVTLLPDRPLRGEAKLAAALERFDVEVTGRRCLDLGAAAGGFTRVLLAHGAESVIALDVGHGQLRGDLRRDPRVLNLERTNLAEAGVVLADIPPIEMVVADLSYISLTAAIPQLDGAPIATDADLIALVKPMFELRLPAPPEDPGSLAAALETAVTGVRAAGWDVVATMPSPVEGSRGAKEWLLHARRTAPTPATAP
jgi:23S rRNA (cytidine1920-2'-O)/16S rRNA (cytidine1409-2'-O)-methyltransferase